jgi:hypothetical protein
MFTISRNRRSQSPKYAFLVNENARISDNTSGGCSRGVFFVNSEVGDKSLKCTTFLYRYVCGNHIVWDAGEINKYHIKHTRGAHRRFDQLIRYLLQYANGLARKDEQKIRSAKSKILGKGKQDTTDTAFGLLKRAVSLKDLCEAYDLAEQNANDDGAPNTYWGLAQGITRLSQRSPFADDRAQLDATAGKLIRIAVD